MSQGGEHFCTHTYGNLMEGKSCTPILWHNQTMVVPHISNTRVKLTNKVDVPEHMCERGKELMHVDAADFVEIAAMISTSPVKKMVSLRGKIVSEGITKTVQVKGRDVKVKNVTLSDKGSSCRLALWRDQATNSTTAMGDFVEVTNVVVNEFDQSKYVSSTRCTDVKKIDSQIRIIAFEHGSDSKIDLMSDEEDFPTYSIEKETLMQGFEVGEEQNITDLLTERIPFDCYINKNDKGDNTFSLFI